MNIDQRIIDQFNSRAPFKLEDATLLVLSHVGSHSHGTYVKPTDPQAIDDIDYMGIVVPPIEFTLGISEWEGLNFQFEELDCVFYSFKKFLSLLVKSNPNVLGMLWMRSEFHIAKHHLWDHLIKNREIFSTRKAYPAFVGYAHAQLKKMESFDLSTQLDWDMNVAMVEAAGWTKEQIIADKHREMPNLKAVREYLLPYSAGCHPDDDTDEKLLVELGNCIKRIRTIHARHFQGYMGEKRKNLVKKYGYDTKNAAHLIRLMRMCCEFLETGVLNVFREQDGDEIRAIKGGQWTLVAVKEESERLFKRAEVAIAECNLPEDIDRNLVNSISIDVYWNCYAAGPAPTA